MHDESSDSAFPLPEASQLPALIYVLDIDRRRLVAHNRATDPLPQFALSDDPAAPLPLVLTDSGQATRGAHWDDLATRDHGARVGGELQAHRTDGTLGWLAWSERIVVDAYGRRALGTAVELFDAPRREAEMLQALAGSGVNLLFQDTNLRYRWARNLRFFDEDALLGRTDFDVLPPEIAGPLAAIKREVLETGAERDYEVALPVVGRRRHFLQRLRPARNAQGQIVGLTAAITDITEFRDRELALQEEERLFHLALANTAVVLYRQDHELRYTWMRNPVGESTQGALGRTDFDLMPPDDAENLARIKRHVMETGEAAREEVTVHVEDGIVIFDLMVQPVRDSYGTITGVTGAAVDVTKWRSLQAQLAQADTLAAIGDLALGVAHEINNPLTAISGHAQLLAGHTDPRVVDATQAIGETTERIRRVIKALLNFAHAQDEGERTPWTLEQIAQTALGIAAKSLRFDGVQVEVIRLSDPEPLVLLNAYQIQEVVLQLLSNAALAVRPRASGNRLVRVETGADPERGAFLRVVDNGMGMSAMVRRRIFEPFFTTRPIGEGSGLGLSLCHGVATAHRGSLEVRSRPGHGSTFTLWLPVLTTGINPDTSG
jgi:PAS domain S-box-containing protein